MILHLYDKFRGRPPASERVKAAMARPSTLHPGMMAPFNARQISQRAGVGRLRLFLVLRKLEKDQQVDREQDWLYRLRVAK